MMFLHRTNILPAGEDSKQKVATCFYLIFQDNEHFSNNIWTAKSAWQPVVGGMFPTFWSPPPCPGNKIDFFLLNYSFFVFVFSNLNINYFANSSLCVRFQSLCFVSKPTVHELQFTSMRPRMNINLIDIHPLNQQSKENI